MAAVFSACSGTCLALRVPLRRRSQALLQSEVAHERDGNDNAAIAPIPRRENYPAVEEAIVATDLLGQARRDVAVAPADLAAAVPSRRATLAAVKINARENDYNASPITFTPSFLQVDEDPGRVGVGLPVCGHLFLMTLGPATVHGLKRSGAQ